MKTDRIWRALSIALALCLTLALAPTHAFATDADAEPAEDGVSTSGVTDVTGGSGVTVKTEVRNNYTDIYQRQTVALVDGTATIADDFSGLDGRNLTFGDLGALTLQAVYDKASNKTTFTVDTSSIQRQQEEQQYTAAEVECKTKMTTTYDGSKLTYTGMTKEDGKTILHEIRDDYYTRNHWCVTFRLTIPAAEFTTIDSVNVTDATLTYQAGDKPQATAKADANAQIAYEYWEEMEENDKGEVVPVKFWYSDPAELAKVPEGKRITQFEAGKCYMYSLMLASAEGYPFAADCALTVNGKAVNGKNVIVGQDGKVMFATALKTLTEGKHHLTVLYTDGQCGTSFTVQAAEDDPTEDANDDSTEDTEEKSSNKSDKAVKSTSKKTGTPKTGDSAAPTLWAGMLMVSGGAVLGVLRWGKRRER